MRLGVSARAVSDGADASGVCARGTMAFARCGGWFPSGDANRHFVYASIHTIKAKTDVNARMENVNARMDNVNACMENLYTASETLG